MGEGWRGVGVGKLAPVCVGRGEADMRVPSKERVAVALLAG